MTKEQAKQRAEIMLAWVNGETIQYRSKRENKWLDSDVDGRLEFNWLDFEYTIKPKWELTNHIPGFRPLREGEEWWIGLEGYKEEWLIGGYRPLLKSEMDGKRHKDVEYADPGTPVPEDKGWWADPTDTGNFRTKRPLPEPKPKLKTVPLEAGDVPPGSVLSFKSWGRNEPRCWVAILQVTVTAGVLVGESRPAWFHWDELNDKFLILRPGSTTWEKCEKIVEEKGEG